MASEQLRTAARAVVTRVMATPSRVPTRRPIAAIGAASGVIPGGMEKSTSRQGR